MIQALVCDDYEPILKLISVVLGGMGISVATACDGSRALELACSLRPDLIISDIDMPGLSGIELFKEISADTTGLASIPFILMSSIDKKWEALEAGCVHFLSKPFSIDDVRQIVNEALSCGESAP